MPVLHLIAGPNGAGKSTLQRILIAPRYPLLPYVSAQAHARTALAQLPDGPERDQKARLWADAERQALLQAGRSFSTETAFSHPSRVALMAQARAMGWEVVLYAMATDEPRRLLERVSQRVREGGHAVASHTVLERYPRTLTQLRQALPLADLAFLIDVCDAQDGGPRLIATVASGKIQLHTVLRPRWVERVLGFAEG